ncbi:hypothetical protein EJP77_00755 [Paenibacillus zeisoli]|uniref:Uncharacterized protein n=1 Tax=Paenibacillus zeisoli TaxID=2496267 RepID=A0A433XNA5_9BACL|nr:hypothetical protein [Paenibacillus zeisoli]RUT35585.1 hypothetical protein EJP77_00755 [Paenibacillus zeisoli]
MKKKWLVLGSTVGLSAALMVTTGLSAMASTSGYEAYKSALKNSHTVQSVTLQANASLKDNGKVLETADAQLKLNLKNGNMSGNTDLSAGGEHQKLSMYNQNEQTILKTDSSDTYYVKQDKDDTKAEFKKMHHSKASDPETSRQVETVIDALVGNLKDYVNMDTASDGSKQISLQLDQAQLPAVVNAIAPLAIKEATKHREEIQSKESNPSAFPFHKQFLKNEVPQLTQDIKIDHVSVKANVNASNYIQHQEADLTVSGKDASGAAHQLVIHLQADFSGFNSTTPDTLDLKGKKVQTLKSNHEGMLKADGNNK